MRHLPLVMVLAAVTLIQVGCAAGFRAGGDHHGVGVGAAVGSVSPPASPAPVQVGTPTSVSSRR